MSPLSLDRAPSRDRSTYLAMMPQLEQHGFLRIPAVGSLRQAADRTFMLANEFFTRPAAEKHRYAVPAWVEGYREMGPEYAPVPERPDLTESFTAWNHNRARSELEAWQAGCPLHGAIRDASDMLADIVRGLFAAMAEYWNPNPGEPAPELRFYDATHIQLNYYEPARHSRDLLQDPHEDGHLVTLVSTNAPGLEIQVDGKFVPADIGDDRDPADARQPAVADDRLSREAGLSPGPQHPPHRPALVPALFRQSGDRSAARALDREREQRRTSTSSSAPMPPRRSSACRPGRDPGRPGANPRGRTRTWPMRRSNAFPSSPPQLKTDGSVCKHAELQSPGVRWQHRL